MIDPGRAFGLLISGPGTEELLQRQRRSACTAMHCGNEGTNDDGKIYHIPQSSLLI